MYYYFAYGSNMNEEQMISRCPSAVLVDKAVLFNHVLQFTIYSPKRKCGCADVVYSENNIVHGLLYKLNGIDIEALDIFEGCPEHYKRIAIEVFCDGVRFSAYCYVVVNKENNLIPSKHYIGLIKDAAKKYNFPTEYRLYLDSFETLK